MSSQIASQLASLCALQQAIADSGILNSTNTIPIQFQQPTLTVRRPWLDPPEGFSPFDAQFGTFLPPLGTPSTVPLLTTALGATAVGSFPVEFGNDGAINAISCNFTGPNFTDFSGDIQWMLFADTKPIRYFNNILAQKGTVQQQRKISPIRIYSGQMITWVVIHVANPALNGAVVCSLTGFTYPNRG